VLAVLLVILLFGSAWAWRRFAVDLASPLGALLLGLIVWLSIALFLPIWPTEYGGGWAGATLFHIHIWGP
jgi:hypothetical protein